MYRTGNSVMVNEYIFLDEAVKWSPEILTNQIIARDFVRLDKVTSSKFIKRPITTGEKMYASAAKDKTTFLAKSNEIQ